MMMLFDEKDSEYFKLQRNGVGMFCLNDGKLQETYFYHSVLGSFTFIVCCCDFTTLIYCRKSLIAAFERKNITARKKENETTKNVIIATREKSWKLMQGMIFYQHED
jgi:hypothetical protein